MVFDHYRPWPAQIPPLQLFLYRLFCSKRLLVNICHSDYTRQRYLSLGIPSEKLCCIHNGFEPERVQDPVTVEMAKARLGIAAGTRTVVYTGRVNHKKGLHLMIEAAKRLPDTLFILVGSSGIVRSRRLPAGFRTFGSSNGRNRRPWRSTSMRPTSC